MQAMLYRQTATVFGIWMLVLTACGAVVGQTQPPAAPAPIGNAQWGAALFTGEVTISNFVACRGCHATDPAAAAAIGPNLAGVAVRAGARIPGVTAEAYLQRSIRIHDEYVVAGFEPGLARAVVGRDYGEFLTDEQIADLTAYLLTLDEPALAQVETPVAQPTNTAMPSPTETSMPTTAATATTTPTPPRSPVPTSVESPATIVSPSVSQQPATIGATTAAATAANATLTFTEVPAPAEAPATATLPATEALPTTALTATPPVAAPTPTAPPAPTATAIAAPVAPIDTGGLPAELAFYTPCMTCHNQHASSVVFMPHTEFPQCVSCHSGSPLRVGCPNCHSTHLVEAPHGGENPNLPCNACHTDR